MYQLCTIAKTVFRAYDIRGIIGKELSEGSYYTLGKVLAVRLQALQRDCIYVARDGRLTSLTLANALIQGLLDSGINIINLGEIATPLLYFATHTSTTDSGLIVTGSHNPANYNGLKIVLAGKTLVQEDIELLYGLMLQKVFLEGMGKLTTQNIVPMYMQALLERIHIQRPMKLVVDAGNGVIGPVAVDLLTALGCEVIPLYCNVDGAFPNHHPDPSVASNLIDLQQAVLQHAAALGIAFDGDADRLGLVSNTAEIIWPDRLMMFYAQHLLKEVPNATIVYDVKCSQHLAKVITAAGGVAKMCPTGHSIIKSIMKESGAALAGEMSGHLFFQAGWYGFDDALYSACRLLAWLSCSDLTMDQQFASIPNSINTPEIKIPISDHEKFTFMEKFIAQAVFPGAELITIDGLRVEFKHGWGLIRASNTTPCLVARFEAADIASLHAIQNLFRHAMHAVDNKLLLGF